MQRGEMYTVTPHRLPHGPACGTWHCRIIGDERDGQVAVQEIKADGDRWRPSMSTAVRVDALVPLAVNVDLFGNPALPTHRRRPTITRMAGRA